MSDYARIADAIRFIASQVARQPTLDEIAAHVHLSPFHFQRLFSRWAGVTPKRYLQVLTLERAKALLQESHPLLEVADTLGLSSGSRLYDHFVQLEAVTPGEYKQRGAGLIIDHGVHDTPFGQAFVALTPRGVCNFSFLDDQAPEAPLAALAQRWPAAELREAPSRTQEVIHTMFDGSKAPDRPISLHVSGTNFQISVWRALLEIPPAKVVSYAQVASAVGSPKAARAVGLAVAAFFKIVVAQSCFKQPLFAPARVSRAAPDLASRHR
ncbi:methylated-DNA--protein-cysteine methyltransferase [Aeromonas caviae]|uniref:Methylated-DNA--protein-cysteine methyltransferase n=1 Tax=Aeromonas caviae TaxID=648 RepID=A0A6S4TPB1_AERCA|nr:methylated-DNA--protein-cysteine methyltransferase [Aeromonas caviae]